MVHLSSAGIKVEDSILRIVGSGKFAKEADHKIGTSGESEILYYPLTTATGREAVNQLRPFMSRDASIVDLTRPNAVLVCDLRPSIAKAKQLLDLIDRNGRRTWPRVVIPCHNVLPSKVVMEMQEILPVLGVNVFKTNDRNELPGSVRRSAVDRRDVVVASAATQEAIDLIKEWVTMLDSSDQNDQERIFVYKVRHNRAEQLAYALSVIFNTTGVNLSMDTNYIRTERVAMDLRWKYQGKYGELDITVNLSKPEKDPKAIAAAKNAGQSSYPKCQLCPENVGYHGRADHPARQNLRTIPLTVAGEAWHLQYSPYVYYNEHCILLKETHSPMSITHQTFARLLDFTEQFPHYFIGSNADLPIVGGSILTHDHFQGGRYTFAMEKASPRKTFVLKDYPDLRVEWLHWPLSVLRLTGEKERVHQLACLILDAWRSYSDPDAMVIAEDENGNHNTITPIARREGDAFQLDLVLRNNVTTQEHPMGLYHPHAEKHHIKKENIGLIEVMGLAVLPARLKAELKELEERHLAGFPMDTEGTEKHSSWWNEILSRREVTSENISSVLEEEVGRVFEAVLEDAGVYSPDERGEAGISRFVASLEQ
jgi:UDPglucose--hexose-1-phosphate uridylyltransferase